MPVQFCPWVPLRHSLLASHCPPPTPKRAAGCHSIAGFLPAARFCYILIMPTADLKGEPLLAQVGGPDKGWMFTSKGQSWVLNSPDMARTLERYLPKYRSNTAGAPSHLAHGILHRTSKVWDAAK